ncbi:MAG: transposase [Clostridia bacterium]|nr:transposase [Clostridia bacterium]
MPRQARKQSSNNMYHIVMRGINRQQIFEDQEDNEKFLEILKDYQAISGYKVFAYCLMGNHFHLLMKFDNEPIEQAMKRIGAKYVYWFNTKYGRVGHLFQDRFKSEPIEDDRYFLCCVRYIHQNPVKAKIAKIDEYPYSSYNIYLNSTQDHFVDTQFLYTLISPQEFVDFNEEIESKEFMDITIDQTVKITDEDARKIIFKICKCNNATEFQAFDATQKNRYLRKLKKRGIGTRQLCRLTGESYYVVQKA